MIVVVVVVSSCPTKAAELVSSMVQQLCVDFFGVRLHVALLVHRYGGSCSAGFLIQAVVHAVWVVRW